MMSPSLSGHDEDVCSPVGMLRHGAAPAFRTMESIATLALPSFRAMKQDDIIASQSAELLHQPHQSSRQVRLPDELGHRPTRATPDRRTSH